MHKQYTQQTFQFIYSLKLQNGTRGYYYIETARLKLTRPFYRMVEIYNGWNLQDTDRTGIETPFLSIGRNLAAGL